MTSSGTYAFSPAAADLVINAFGRIGIRRAAITVDQLIDAAMESNLLLTQWGSIQPLLWRSETQLISSIVQGTATYSPFPRTVSVLLASIRTGTGSSQVDRVIGPLSTTDYASLSNKTTQGPPTSFWFNRQIAPSITLWPVPDASSTYTLVLQTVSQVQDVALANGQTLDTPYRFLDAFTAGLSHRLARLYAPAMEQARKADAMDAWQIASGNDVEDVPLVLAANIGSYFR